MPLCTSLYWSVLIRHLPHVGSYSSGHVYRDGGYWEGTYTTQVSDQVLLAPPTVGTNPATLVKYQQLRCINILQETTIQVMESDSTQLFLWKGYGLTLRVPPKSLSSNIKCTITIIASLSGQYEFPASKELFSPVFWLKCEPSVKFLKELDLEIEHCAPLEYSPHLFIALCTQKEPPYSFTQFYGGTFKSNVSYYKVRQLGNFNGFAVIGKTSRRRYLSNVFYMGPFTNRCIHFTVTWHLDAHTTVS